MKLFSVCLITANYKYQIQGFHVSEWLTAKPNAGKTSHLMIQKIVVRYHELKNDRVDT
jgi:hypothetical protein